MFIKSVDQIRCIDILQSNFPATPTTKYVKVKFYTNTEDGNAVCQDEYMNLENMNEWRHVLAIILQKRSASEAILYMGSDNFSMRWIAKYLVVKGTDNINVSFKRRSMSDVAQ